MKDATKQMLKSAIFEATFVVLGVVLALTANEWRQSLAAQAASERAVESIKQEIIANNDLVKASLSYHQDLMQTLFAAAPPDKPADISLFNKGFVFPAKVTTTAWQTASETGVLRNTDYETVLALSRSYDAQHRYNQQADSIGEIIYQRLFDGGIKEVTGNSRNLASIISTLAYKEDELLKHYTQTLEYLDKKASQNSP